MPKQVSDIAHENAKDWRWKFLDALARSANVSVACQAAHVPRSRAYNHRARFPRFRSKWDEALEIATELLEFEIRYRAFDRKDPASATLAIFLLKAHKPEKYRDNYRPKLTDDSEIDVTELSDEQLQAIVGNHAKQSR